MSIETTGLVFDVATTLGLGPVNNHPLPAAIPGAIVLRVPEGISLQSLRDKELMQPQDWYENLKWNRSPLAAGIYSLRLPIPESNKKTFAEHQSLLHEGESVAPVTLVAIALLCFQKQNLSDPLNGGWVRCQETAGVYGVVLAWCDGRLYVDYYWNDVRDDSVWGAGVRTS